MIKVNHIEGKDKGKILVYALSTCVWCKKLKKLLGELGVAYDFIDVDTCDEDEGNKLEEEMKKWNPKCTYPTVVINGNKGIGGYDEKAVKELLG